MASEHAARHRANEYLTEKVEPEWVNVEFREFPVGWVFIWDFKRNVDANPNRRRGARMCPGPRRSLGRFRTFHGDRKEHRGYVDRYENATRCKVLGLPDMSEYSGRKSAFRATRKSGLKESDSDVAVRCRAGCPVVRRQFAERGGLRRRIRMLEQRRPTNLVFRSTAEPPDWRPCRAHRSPR